MKNVHSFTCGPDKVKVNIRVEQHMWIYNSHSSQVGYRVIVPLYDQRGYPVMGRLQETKDTLFICNPQADPLLSWMTLANRYSWMKGSYQNMEMRLWHSEPPGCISIKIHRWTFAFNNSEGMFKTSWVMNLTTGVSLPPLATYCHNVFRKAGREVAWGK